VPDKIRAVRIQKRGGSLLVLKEDEPVLEVIAVKIESSIRGTYKGLGGTFASFVDSCLRKKALPGFYEKGLIAEAKRKDKNLSLCLSGKRPEEELMEVMEIALHNIGAYPDKGGNADFFIEVKSI
jgi:hypothetical protein